LEEIIDIKIQSYFGHIFLPKKNGFQKIEGAHLCIDWDDFWFETSINLYGVIWYNLIKCKN